MIDKKKLALLKSTRQNFLKDTPSVTQNYWQTQETLEAYDEVFARRISWKWQAVVTELQELQLQLPTGNVLDFGCGTGVASEVLSDLFPRHFLVHDRSDMAMNFTLTKLRHRNVAASKCAKPHDQDFATFIASHILTELSEADFASLIKLIQQAQLLIFVDAGTPPVSKRLTTMRAALLSTGWHMIAPCTHQQPCPAADLPNDWCHFHPSPPREIFHDATWAELSRELGIDLRSIPVSYLVMANGTPERTYHAGARLIGRPKQIKFGIRCFKCSDQGYVDCQMKLDKSAAKAIEKDPFCVIL
jgi:ribosomal protein RSM22 (predicted rRNA methylase)